jgi:hypothetical protein
MLATAAGQISEPGEAAATRATIRLPARCHVIVDKDPAGVWGIVVGDKFLDLSRHVIDVESRPASTVLAASGSNSFSHGYSRPSPPQAAYSYST